MGVENVPVVDGGICDKAQGVLVEESPEDNILIHGMRLQLLLAVQVEDLQRPRLGLERDDLLVPVQQSAVRFDVASYYVIAIL